MVFRNVLTQPDSSEMDLDQKGFQRDGFKKFKCSVVDDKFALLYNRGPT